MKLRKITKPETDREWKSVLEEGGKAGPEVMQAAGVAAKLALLIALVEHCFEIIASRRKVPIG